MTKLAFKFIFFFIISSSFAEENYIFLSKFKEHSANKVVFLRHAHAPGNGDPSNFDVNDCSTQRNLDKVGIDQSKFIGNSLKKMGIKFSKIYSSFWCRCQETALYMKIGEFESHDGLNSFYEEHADRTKTLKKLKILINSFNKSKGPYLLVTHYVNILAFTGLSTLSGGMVAFNLKTNKSTHIRIKN